LREAFDDPAEWHAFFDGFARSVKSHKQRVGNPTTDDAKENPRYHRAGWLVGDGVQILAVAAVVLWRTYGG
jgi:hypothetical protein